MPTRQSTVKTAQTYLENGLALHDFKRVALAKDAVRTENGWDTGHNAQGVRDTSAGFSGQWSIRINKWVVQGSEAVAFSDLYTNNGHRVCTSHYVKVGGEQIKELRITFNVPEMPGNGLGVATLVPAVKAPTGNAEVRVVQTFLNGLQKNDLSGAKLGPDVMITENGEVKALARDAALQYWRETYLGKVRGITVTRWVADGSDVVALYQLDRAEGRPLWITQYFRVYGGLIRETWANSGGGPTTEEKKTAYKPPVPAPKRAARRTAKRKR